MNSLLEQLHDIEGLDQISWWPLAPAWWIAIALCFLFAAALVWLAVVNIRFRRSWKNDTLRKLALLEKNLTESTAAESAIALSEYLRRIALKQYPRNECAGLSGQAWLKWLTMRDPKNYDWERHGAFLIDAPYAPAHTRIASGEMRALIQAAKNWVR